MTTVVLADDQRPRALPIRPRPQAGETPASYIRRLARANHLRPAYLNRYLRDPGRPGQVRLDWLAALADRPATSLEHAFTQTPQRHRPQPDRRKNSKADLFAAIRRDADSGGMSVRALADRYGVHRRTVHQALASPVPAPRKRPTGRTSKLDPFKEAVNALLQQEIDHPDQPARTARGIFDWLVTEHGATQISYSTVRNYVADRRSLRPRPRRTAATVKPSATPASASPPRGSTPMTMSPAHLAVEHEDLPRLRDLLNAGHDVEDDNGDGWTLLRHAVDVEHDGHVQTGLPLHADVTAFLLARGADPRRRRDGTPLVTEAETRGHWLAAEIMNAWIGRNPKPPATR